jgi:lactonase
VRDGWGARSTLLALSVLMNPLAPAVLAQTADQPPALVYDALTRGPVPIPPGERGLQTVVATPWFKVSSEALALEGPAFDRSGDLLFCDASHGQVFRLTLDRHLSTVLGPTSLGLGGLALHRDGRIFAAGTGNMKTGGSVVAINPDGTGLTPIVPSSAGYVVNDLVFDAQGGFYFTDFRGSSTDPQGGVYYVASDLRTITPVLPHLAMANGVALSPDGKTLWVTEFSRNLLHRVELQDATTPTAFGTAVVYHFTGPAPDSLRADSDGNVYVALYGQGRVLVFNPHGIPIGQVLLPGRDEGFNLNSTSMALRPGTNELYVVTHDGRGKQGAAIFRARAFASALSLYGFR